MAHKTLISGTAYSVTGGRDLIGGTGYDCKAGKTLIGGTAFTVPFSKGIPLNTITPGAILYLNESGSHVPFYIAKHDYESGLNGAGRTLVVRKDCYDSRTFGRNNVYENSAMDKWLNGTYLTLLDEAVQTAIATTKFYHTTILYSNFTLATLQRAVFLLSVAEYGFSSGSVKVEGSKLPIAETLRIAYHNGSAVAHWTRSRSTGSSVVPNVDRTGNINASNYGTGNIYSRPVFTLPGDLVVIANADDTYTLAA